MDTLDHKFRYSERRVPSPTEARLLTSDYKDIWFFFEKSPHGVFTQFP